MISRSSPQESDRFNTKHPDLCPALRWKAQFILTEPDPTGYNRQDIEGLFKQGRIGMILTGPWLRGQIKTEAPKLNYGIAQIPAFVLKDAMDRGALELMLADWIPEPVPLAVPRGLDWEEV